MSNPLCPVCSGQASRNGSLKVMKAEAFKYVCTRCSACFSTFTGTVFHYLNAVPRVVALSLELVNQYGLPLRKASHFLEKRFKFNVPKSTLGDWNCKLAGVSLSLEKPCFTSVWHVDEVFVRHEERLPGGKRKWFDFLWVVCDDANNVVALYLSGDRSQKSAEAVLEKAKTTAGFSPRVLVSDEYCVYPNAVRKVFGRKTMHVTRIVRGLRVAFSTSSVIAAMALRSRADRLRVAWMNTFDSLKYLRESRRHF